LKTPKLILELNSIRTRR